MSAIFCSIKRSGCFSMLFFIFALISSMPLQAEKESITKIVKVIGTGVISNNDITQARERAISNSLISAVELVAADFIPVEILMKNFQQLNESIYADTNQFIQDYRVLAEAKVENDYRIMIQTTVLIDNVRKKLSIYGNIGNKRDMPKILLLISEENFNTGLSEFRIYDKTHYANLSEYAMAEALRKNGFMIINYDNKEFKKKDISIKGRGTAFDDQVIADLGARLNADVVIVGKVIAERVQSRLEARARSYKAILTASAYMSDTGIKFADTTQTYVAAGADDISGKREAFSEVGLIAGRYFSLEIEAQYRKEDIEDADIEIIVEGVNYLADFVKFRRIIKNMSGVKGIQTKEIKSDESTAIVKFRGNSKELADAIISETYDSFSVNIDEISQKRLKVKLIPIDHSLPYNEYRKMKN